MVVEPSNQNLFIAETLHDIVGFVCFFEENDLWILFKRDFLGNADLSGMSLTLMICQIKPRMMCYLFSMMN